MAKIITKDISPKEYAAWRGCSVSNITKQIRHDRALPGVIKVKGFNRFYLLEVDINMNADTFKEGKLPAYKTGNQ
ncbi:MAG TPA: hypothetical protein PK431_17180 [Chitinophagales bacterium]|nr:hypothetical protein [Chitinophagales bacterium]